MVKGNIYSLCYVLILFHAVQAAIFTFAKRHDFEYMLTCCEKTIKLSEKNVAKGFFIFVTPLIMIIIITIFMTENCQLWYKTWLKADCFITIFMIANIYIEQQLLKRRERLLGMHIVSRIHIDDHERAEDTLKLMIAKTQKQENKWHKTISNMSKNLKMSVIDLKNVLSDDQINFLSDY